MERGKLAAAELLGLGVKLALDAAEKVLGDPRGQAAVSAASELAQKAVRKLEELQGSVTRAAGAPRGAELRDLEKKVEELQRRARELGARLEELAHPARPGYPPRGRAGKAPWRDPDDPEPR